MSRGPWRDAAVGLGLVAGAAIGIIVGVVVGGAGGVALGIGLGGAFGLVAGAVVRVLMEDEPDR